jgi:hypothetical protein
MTFNGNCLADVPRLPHDDADPNEDEDLVNPDERKPRTSLIFTHTSDFFASTQLYGNDSI